MLGYKTQNYFNLLCLAGWLFNFSSAQLKAQPNATVDFSFNNKSALDEQSKTPAKLVNASFTEDRFGNKDHAVHLFGNNNSYLNLGSSASLKPRSGSISIWVKVENALWYGTGYKTNPILVTKRSREDDFFEAYALYYMFETKKVTALCTQDSTNQVIFSSTKEFELQKWHHLVFTYDKDFAAFYIDGELDNRFKTGFELEFLPEDSVILGVTANRKNQRFFSGSVDDIRFYNKVLGPEEVKKLYREPDPNLNNRILSVVRWIILALLFLAIVYILVRRHLKQKFKEYQETLKLKTRLLETELRVNRALMNPHFIFNSLNSIQNLILNNKNEEANAYLLKFSKLIRKILESNTSESISLADELEVLQRYLELEHLRFQKDFEYRIKVEENINPNQVRIPIMMVQPFVENAIWHGLMNKSGERMVRVSFSMTNEQYLYCVIDDNGLGRAVKRQELKDKKSMATVFVQSRLELINKIHNLACKLSIIDKPDSGGTRVELILPVLK